MAFQKNAFQKNAFQLLLDGPRVATTLTNKHGRYFSRREYAEWLARIVAENDVARAEYEEFVRQAEEDRNLTDIQRATRDFDRAEEEYTETEDALFGNVTTTNHIKFSEAKEKRDKARKERDHHYFMEVVKREWERAKKH